jgi:hypothetical protein
VEDRAGVGDPPVEDQDGRPAGLGDDRRAELGVARGLVTEPASGRVHQEAAVHDRGPAGQRAMRHRQRPVPLAGIEERGACPEGLADPQGVAAREGASVVGRARHLGQVLAHEAGIGAEAVGRQEDGAAGDLLAGAVRVADHGDPAARLPPHAVEPGGHQQVDSGPLGGRQQALQQQRAAAAGDRVAAQPAVAGVPELGCELDREPRPVGEPGDEPGAHPGEGRGQPLVGLSLRLGQHVRGH